MWNENIKNIAKKNYSRWICHENAIIFGSENEINQHQFHQQSDIWNQHNSQYFSHTANWMNAKIIVYALINSISV